MINFLEGPIWGLLYKTTLLLEEVIYEVRLF